MTTREFKNKIFTITNDEYEVLGEYINCDTPIKLKHNVCGYVWETTTPYSFTKKNKPTRCPRCARVNNGIKSRLSKEEFINKINEKNKNKFKFISEYISGDKPITIMCNNCGNIFEIKKAKRLIYDNVLCRKCETPKYQTHKTTQWFKNRMCEICGNEYELIGEFNGVDNYVTLKHNVCGHIYNSTIGASFLAGTRCPYCNESKGEKMIHSVLNKYDIQFETNKTFNDLKGINGGILSYDVYIQEYNLLIEYQGEQHDHPIKYSKTMTDKIAQERFLVQKQNDDIKKMYAQKNNYNFLEIWFRDFNNIEIIIRRKIECLERQEQHVLEASF